MEYSYIGRGEIKFLDKKCTKFGAFLELDVNDLSKAIDKFEVIPNKIKINVLPSKDGTFHSVKLIY